MYLGEVPVDVSDLSSGCGGIFLCDNGELTRCQGHHYSCRCPLGAPLVVRGRDTWL